MSAPQTAAAMAQIESLIKALDAGSYNVAPGSLNQGAALQIEDLASVIENVTFGDEHLKLQAMLGVKGVKSTLAQFDRQLSYGNFGGSAQLEGNLGAEKTSDFVRVVVPMCYYSHARRVTVASTLVATVDGTASDERAASDAAKIIAADVEFDLFLGRAHFSNAGVFDGNPLAIPSVMANIIGVDVQVRQSDAARIATDIYFAEFGGDESVVVEGGGVLTQDLIEEATLRSVLHMGNADKLVTGPRALAMYNKIAFGKERIILAGSPQAGTGADLRKQWTSSGTASLEASRFLEGKSKPAEVVSGGPAAPTLTSVTAGTISGAVTPFENGDVYTYFVTTGNERGESAASAAVSDTIGADGDGVTLVITPPGSGTPRWFNVYRTAAGGAASTAKFIGRVANSGNSTTSFVDLGNRQPAASDGYLIQGDTMEIKELAPYSRLKLAVADLSLPEAHFRFCSLACMQPRKNTIIANLR